MDPLKVGDEVRYKVGRGYGVGTVAASTPIQLAIRTPGGRFVCRRPQDAWKASEWVRPAPEPESKPEAS